MATEVSEGSGILSEGLKLLPLGQKLSQERQKGKAPNSGYMGKPQCW